MKIGVVIPVINLWSRFTEPCIKSLVSSYPLRVVIIDNGSVDETQGKGRSMMNNSSNVFYIRNEKNMGCAYAWNQGVRNCFENECDYALVINNDAVFHPRAIDRLVERYNKAENNFAKGRVVDDPVWKNTDIVTDGSSTEKESGFLAMVTCMNIRGECEKPEDVFDKNDVEKEGLENGEHPDFSAFMISRMTVERVGEFDEGFYPAYFEDNDFHYRINLAGLKAVTYPPAMFYHYGSGTSNENKISEAMRGVQFERNHAYFREKWGGDSTNETFRKPFNDESKTIKWTK